MASKMGTTTRKKRTSRSALQQLAREFISLPNRPLRFSVEVRIIGFPATAPIRKQAAQMQDVLDRGHPISAQLIHQQRNSGQVLHCLFALACLPIIPELYIQVGEGGRWHCAGSASR